MEPQKPDHPLGTRADDVPQTRAQGIRPGEEAALTWIDSALAHQRMVAERGSSRESSLAITKLEEAKFWATQDLQTKKEQAAHG